MPGAKRVRRRVTAALALTAAVFVLSLMVGRYDIRWSGIFRDTMDARVFFQLRLPRTLMALCAGVGLGVAGSVYQAVFHNPLAAPDVMGVASGASAGAAAAIVLLGGGAVSTASCAFAGGMAAVLLALTMSRAAGRQGMMSVVLSGIAVNALAQALLMLLKLTADPERQLASIEFWMMGSFADITLDRFCSVIVPIALGIGGLFVLHRPIALLSLGDDDAQMLGLNVRRARAVVLLLSTLVTSAVVSATGLIAFAGLIAPHLARLITGSQRIVTTALAGVLGGGLLLAADILARTAAGAELPVSVVLSLLGVPFLLWLMCRRAAYDA